MIDLLLYLGFIFRHTAFKVLHSLINMRDRVAVLRELIAEFVAGVVQKVSCVFTLWLIDFILHPFAQIIIEEDRALREFNETVTNLRREALLYLMDAVVTYSVVKSRIQFAEFGF